MKVIQATQGQSPISLAEFQQYKDTVNGQFYSGSLLINTESSVSLYAECCEIIKYLKGKFGDNIDDYEAVYQDEEWLPEIIAKLARVRGNGRNLNDAV